MLSDPTRRDRINSFALVTYIPEPLAGFLNRLREELVPSSNLQSHVTILPPRLLLVKPEEAWRHICELAPAVPAFDVELTEVRVFTSSGVIYIDIGGGNDRIREMHAVFNSGILESAEMFEFCPHVTLAQGIVAGEAEALVERAKRRWAEYPHRHGFRVNSVTFVQNTAGNTWIDLARCQLGTGEMKLLEPMAVK